MSYYCYCRKSPTIVSVLKLNPYTPFQTDSLNTSNTKCYVSGVTELFYGVFVRVVAFSKMTNMLVMGCNGSDRNGD
jgi:hypothetical protein